MGRPKKEYTRIRMQITLAPETSQLLRSLSEKTYIPMSNLLDMMINEYSRTHEDELKEKGICYDG